ncbi:MAG: hypothetical protein KJN71_07390 [Acidimicrobiia bacterium]|nr:hypothetical protein [Acidimicrobiia bacterium]NNC75234.1 hypothetical protein [Acidimicrobiia bacterium]
MSIVARMAVVCLIRVAETWSAFNVVSGVLLAVLLVVVAFRVTRRR